MKQYKTAIIAVFVAALIVPAVAFIAVPHAEAACSYQGFLSSGGKCAKSFSFTSYDRYDDDDDHDYFKKRKKDRFSNNYGYGDLGELHAYLARLIALLDLLRELQGLQYGSSQSDDFNITTRSATAIDEDSATLRGRVAYGESDDAEVWFEYGMASDELDEDTSKLDLDEDDDEFSFSRTITGLEEDTKYYYRAVGEDDEDDKDRGAVFTFRTDGEGDDSDPDVTTDAADNVTGDSAELNGRVDMNDFNNGHVFFVYGEDESQVEDVEDDYDTYSEVDENGDDLQKVLRDSDLDSSEDYAYVVDELDTDTEHFFTMCVAYEDEDSDDLITCGTVRNFTTGDNGSSDEDPGVVTNAAQEVDKDSAELNGSVDMNDFKNGRAFFVYGEDESQVEDIENNFDTYTAIDEDGANLQKVLTDSDLDASESYAYVAGSLDEGTTHYFSMCVEYENEDSDDVISCGTVREFTTVTTIPDAEEPTANTDDVDDVASTTAELNGAVDMNDFDNGRVFFVYGTDETQVGDVATDYDTFSSIPDNDVLSKASVDNDLDTVGSYAEVVTALGADTEYFSSICVEFEDDDNNDKLVCGDIERFMTDAS